jgi:hypothetical protein
MKLGSLSPKDKNLIKSALRRAFSRSTLRQEALQRAVVKHYDPSRPRVRTWCKCEICGLIDARSYFHIDHKLPVVDLDKTLDDMDVNELVSRLWCSLDNLQAIDVNCHESKTKGEAILRREYKRDRKIKECMELGGSSRSGDISIPTKPKVTRKRKFKRSHKKTKGRSRT